MLQLLREKGCTLYIFCCIYFFPPPPLHWARLQALGLTWFDLNLHIWLMLFYVGCTSICWLYENVDANFKVGLAKIFWRKFGRRRGEQNLVFYAKTLKQAKNYKAFHWRETLFENGMYTRIVNWQNMLPLCLRTDGFNVCPPGILWSIASTQILDHGRLF